MTHAPRVAENYTTHPLHKAQNLMTHPLSALAHLPYFLTSLLRYAYNHVFIFLEKTSRLSQIRSLTRLKLRIISSMRSFIASHIPDRLSRVQIGFDQISPSSSSTRDLGTRLASTLTGMKLQTNPSDSQSNNASDTHLNSLALISFFV